MAARSMSMQLARRWRSGRRAPASQRTAWGSAAQSASSTAPETIIRARRACLGRLLEYRVEVPIGYKRRGLAIVEKIAKLVTLGERINDAHHGVGLQHRPETDDRLDSVVGKDNHPVAAHDTAGSEMMRDRIGARLELTIGDARSPQTSATFPPRRRAEWIR